MASRLPNWERKLYEAIEARASHPLHWGFNDCCAFTLFVLKEISGIDYLDKAQVPKYSSKLGAAKVIQKLGDGDLLAIADRVFGERKGITGLRRGNAVSCYTQDGPALGVWVSPFAVFTGEKGLVMVPRQELICSWET